MRDKSYQLRVLSMTYGKTTVETWPFLCCEQTSWRVNSHMLHGVLKQNQVHGSIQFIVAVQGFRKNRPQYLRVLHRQVTGILPTVSKVAIDKGLLKQRVTVYTLREEEKTESQWPVNGKACCQSVSRRHNVPKYGQSTFQNHNRFQQGRHPHHSVTSVSNSALTPVRARANGHLGQSTHLLRSICKQFPAFFSETDHNPSGLPVCLHKHVRIHEAKGILNHLDILNIQEKQVRSPTRKKMGKIKTQKLMTFQNSIFF